MRLALAIVFLWTGSALLSIASRGLEASTPWQAYKSVLNVIRSGADEEGATDGG